MVAEDSKHAGSVPAVNDGIDVLGQPTPLSPWPSVSSPVARRVLQTVYAGLDVPNDAYEQLSRERSAGVQAGVSELRQRLRRSGIAQGIAAGLDLLPDIYEHLPPLWRGAMLANRPRKPEALAIHILENLYWYLNPASIPHPRTETTLALLLALLCALAASCLALLFLKLLGDLFLACGVLALIVLAHFALDPLLRLFERLYAPSSTSSSEAIEYFLYLLESYSDEQTRT